MISIIVLSYNSAGFIESCLKAISDQDYRNFEIIVVDNGSKDNTLLSVKKDYPGVKIIKNRENLGACIARNKGIDASKGEWILTLDCDVILEKDFLGKIMKAAEASEKNTGMFQAKVLQADKKAIYSYGIYLSNLRRFHDIGRAQADDGRFDRVKYVFGACSAAALYRKQMLEDVKEKTGYFDERFFFLVEDVDLAWRAQKKGWKAEFCPEAICYHAGNSSDSSRKMRQYLCFRNRHYLLIKNEDVKNFYKNMVFLLLYDFLRFFYLFPTNPYTIKAAKEIIKFAKKASMRKISMPS